MRVRAVEHGHRLKQKLILTLIRIVAAAAFRCRQDAHVPARVLRRAAVRLDAGGDARPSDWSIGERELFAAFTSKLNQCVF